MLRLISLCMHAVAITPTGIPGALVTLLPQYRRPSPYFSRVGSHNTLFEACSAFTARYGLHARRSPKVTLYTGGFSSFVTSTTAPIATCWSDKLPGGNHTR